MRIINNLGPVQLRKQEDQLTLEDLEAYCLSYFNHPGLPYNGALCPVTSIKWIAYTPYFNDGDECVYSVNGPGLVLDGLSQNDEYDDEDVFEETNSAIFQEGHIWSFTVNKNHPGSYDEIGYSEPKKDGWYTYTNVVYHGSFTRIKRINPNKFENVFREHFGDHCQVTATLANGELVFTVDPYDHD